MDRTRRQSKRVSKSGVTTKSRDLLSSCRTGGENMLDPAKIGRVLPASQKKGGNKGMLANVTGTGIAQRLRGTLSRVCERC